MNRNDLSVVFVKQTLLDRCVYLPFFFMIIYNYANCFSSAMLLICYGSINLLQLFKTGL